MIDCSECINHKKLPSACCQDVTIRLNETDQGNLSWWGEMRWMVAHEKVSIAREIETSEWVVIFETPCSKLSPEGRCTIYTTRPKICFEYSAQSCVINGEGDIYDLHFHSMEEVDAYIKEEVLENLKEKNFEALKDVRRDQWQLSVWPNKERSI